MEYKSKAIGSYISHWNSPGGWSVNLFGEGITVRFKPLESGVWIDQNFVEHKIEPSRKDQSFKPGFFDQMLGFKKLIEKKKLFWPSVSLEESFNTMKLVDSFSKSSKNK